MDVVDRLEAVVAQSREAYREALDHFRQQQASYPAKADTTFLRKTGHFANPSRHP